MCVTRPGCGAEVSHLNSLRKVRKTGFDTGLLSSAVGVRNRVLNVKNFHYA